MLIEHVAGYVNLTLDEKELTLNQNIWMGFIEDLKREVPREARNYDPETRIWNIDEIYYETVLALRKRHFSDPNQLDLL